MIGIVGGGDMLVNIDQPGGQNFNADFFPHFPVQGGKNCFTMLNLATGHDPQTMKGRHAAAGEEDAFIMIDDTGNN